MSDVEFALFDTKLGRCAVAWAERGIVAVQLPQPDEAQTRVRLKQRYADCREATPPPSVQAVIDRITALMDGQAVDLADVELDLAEVPEFNRNVYAIARKIPAGKTLTYGDIARQLGGVELSRDVGRAMGQNPCPVIVPCHRVLAAGGKPGGFSANGGVETKLKMLAIEGAYVNYTPSLFD
ncbi:MAG: methylated-DNA--[protein]-cysteine S-methyltransferase [Tardiphaga sp.]